MEENPVFDFSDRRKALLQQVLPNIPTDLYYVVKGKGKGKKSRKTLEEEKEKGLPMQKMCEHATPQSKIKNLPDLLVNADKVTYMEEEPGGPPESNLTLRDLLVNKVTIDNIQDLVKDKKAIELTDLKQATSTKSTIVYFPEKVKLTDKHLAQMNPPSSFTGTKTIIWPPRMTTNDKLGSLICVVSRIDDNNYDFKVYMMPGEYTYNDPVTLTQMMHYFNPLVYDLGQHLSKREAALKKATMLVAAAANEFFGPQLVNMCIALWLSCRPRPLSPKLKIKKSNMIIKLKNARLDGPPPLAKKKLLSMPAKIEPECPCDSVDIFEALKTGARRKINLSTTTKYANYLTGIFGYNRAMYPDVHSISAHQSMLPQYDFIREIHASKEELYHILSDISPVNKTQDNRMKG